jgi:hypothetical protein
MYVMPPEVISTAHFIKSPISNTNTTLSVLQLALPDVISDKDVLSADVTVMENSPLTADVCDVPVFKCVYRRGPEIKKIETGSATFFKQNSEVHALIQTFSRYPGGFVDCSAL